MEQDKFTTSDAAESDFVGNVMTFYDGVVYAGVLSDDDDGNSSGSAYIFNPDRLTATATVTITVEADADAPNLAVSSSTGDQDTAIPLDITSSLKDTDGSETLSIVISDVPAGATLSAGTDNLDGSWTLTPAELVGLNITPPAGSTDDFPLTVTATATESSNSDTESTAAPLTITVNDVNELPTAIALSNQRRGRERGVRYGHRNALGERPGCR